MRAKGLGLVVSLLIALAITPADFDRLADAIYKAEGGAKASKPYGILSVSCKGQAACRRVCLNTIRNNWARWQNAGNPGEYLEFLGSRYAPVGAGNDPAGLNTNWIRNVRWFYERG